MRLLFRLCHERRLFTSRERFSVTAHRFENFPRIVRSLFDATRDYAKRRNVSLSDITPRFWIACSRKTQNRDDTSRRFQKFEVLKYSFFPPTFRKKKKRKTYFVRPLVSRIDFPESQSCWPWWGCSPSRLFTKFWEGARPFFRQPPWSSRVRHGPRERRTGPPLWLLRPVDTLGHPFVACIGVKLKTCFQKILLRNLIARSNNYDASTIRKSRIVGEISPSSPSLFPISNSIRTTN